MVKRGFSFSFLLKQKKPRTSGPKVLFYTTKPDVIQPKKHLRRLVWRPKLKTRPLPEISDYMIKVGLGVVLALLVYLLLGSQTFVLTTLEIQGNHLVPDTDIKQTMFQDGFEPVNAFLFNENQASQQVLSILQIREARFKKLIFKKKLVVTISEHETTIIWQTNNERFMVNRAGVVYDVAPEDSPLIVIEDLKNVPINLNQKIVTTDFIEFVTSAVSNLPRRTNVSARRVLVPETTFEIEVITSEGWTIIFDTTRSVDTQINNLVKVLRSIKELPTQYIDLRIEDRVYYR